MLEVASSDPEVGYDALSREMRFVDASPLGVDRVKHAMTVRVAMAPTNFFGAWASRFAEQYRAAYRRAPAKKLRER